MVCSISTPLPQCRACLVAVEASRPFFVEQGPSTIPSIRPFILCVGSVDSAHSSRSFAGCSIPISRPQHRACPKVVEMWRRKPTRLEMKLEDRVELEEAQKQKQEGGQASTAAPLGAAGPSGSGPAQLLRHLEDRVSVSQRIGLS